MLVVGRCRDIANIVIHACLHISEKQLEKVWPANFALLIMFSFVYVSANYVNTVK